MIQLRLTHQPDGAQPFTLTKRFPSAPNCPEKALCCVAQVWGHRGSCLCSSWWHRTEQQHDPAAADATARWRTVIHPHEEIPECSPLPWICIAWLAKQRSCDTPPKAGWVDVGGLSGVPWSCVSI